MTQLFTGYVGGMLQQYGADPKGAWRAKDCAVYLVTALAARGRTAAGGVPLPSSSPLPSPVSRH